MMAYLPLLLVQNALQLRVIFRGCKQALLNNCALLRYPGLKENCGTFRTATVFDFFFGRRPVAVSLVVVPLGLFRLTTT